jgi:hypothetical protein
MDEGTEVGLRRERAAANESLFRQVNERIQDLSSTASFNQFVCECYDDHCDKRVPMTVEEYEHIRAHPKRFFVLPGHHSADVDEVVEATDRYVVVQKIGAGERVAEQLDPRSR